MTDPERRDPAERTRAIGMLLIANLFWGLSFPVIKALALLEARLCPGASGGFLVASLVAPRFVLAGLILAPLIFRSGIRPAELRQGLFVGLFSCAGMLLQSDGLRFTAASTSAFLTQFYAITIPVWLAMRSRRMPPLTIWVSCVLVLAGVAILGRFDWRELRFGRGELETLLSSLFFMGQILWLEHRAFAGNRAFPVSFVMFSLCGVAYIALAVSTAPNLAALAAPMASGPWVGLTVLLTLFSTVASYVIMNAWQPRISATEAGLIYCAEPIFGSILALFLPALFSTWAAISYPNERATVHLVMGGGLVTLANFLIQRRPAAARD